MRGSGIQYRLQGHAVDPAGPLPDTFDLDAWKEGTTLSSFGVELFVTAGRASLSLEHTPANDAPRTLCHIDQPVPGRVFSPPLHLAELDGQLRPQLTLSDDAVVDVYFGTNDRPETAFPRLALIVDAKDDRNAAEAVMAAVTSWRSEFGPHHALEILLCLTSEAAGRLVPPYGVTPLVFDAPSGTSRLGRAMFETLFGRLSDLPLTHAGTSSVSNAAEPETFVRLLAMARFLRPGVHLACGPEKPATGGWGCHLWHISDLFGSGLPHMMRTSDDGTEFVSRLTHVGLRTISPTSLGLPWQTITPDPIRLPWRRGAGALRRRLARLTGRAKPVDPDALLCSFPAWQSIATGTLPAALPHPGSAAAAAMLHRHHEMTGLHRMLRLQTRAAKREVAAQYDPLFEQLRSADLFEPDRVRSDLDRTNRTSLSLLRDRHKGERVYIVGNGPSLTVADLDRLSGATCFASNKIYLAYDETNWRPTYYSVEDHLVLLNNKDRIEALEGSIKIFPASMRPFGFHSADTLFMPFVPPASFDDPLSDPDFPGFSRDLSQGVCWGSTITYTQVQMALYMGASEIVLLGIDHSYDLPDTRDGNTYVHAGERNHFHPDYRSHGEVWHQPNLPVLEVSYAKARDVCAASGVRIVNASRRTALKIFERADLDLLLAEEGR